MNQSPGWRVYPTSDSIGERTLSAGDPHETRSGRTAARARAQSLSLAEEMKGAADMMPDPNFFGKQPFVMSRKKFRRALRLGTGRARHGASGMLHRPVCVPNRQSVAGASDETRAADLTACLLGVSCAPNRVARPTRALVDTTREGDVVTAAGRRSDGYRVHATRWSPRSTLPVARPVTTCHRMSGSQPKRISSLAASSACTVAQTSGHSVMMPFSM
jgi:hypothetical protein